jgi:hypothetical protein
MNISFVKLTTMFPKDTMWVDGCAEIIGYSPKENLHIVIDDGQCKSDDGMYMVHKYHPLDQQMHMLDWNSGKYPLKYLSKSAKKVFEGWINFND